MQFYATTVDMLLPHDRERVVLLVTAAATSEHEATGQALEAARDNHPKASILGFMTTDITEHVRAFVRENP